MTTRTLTIQPADGGLAILRLAVGAVFVAHGVQKLFEMGLPAVTQFFAHVGIPHPGLAAPGVALLEFIGGLALLAGIATRGFALLIAIEMLGAIYYVHAPNGFFAPNGWEYPLTLCAANLALVLVGPGYLSVDGVIARARYRARTATTLSDDWLAKTVGKR